MTSGGFSRQIKRLTPVLAAVTMLASCATGSRPVSYQPNVDPSVTAMPDRIESVNRFTFKINDYIDRYSLQPIARGYHDVTPAPVRNSVNNFLINLKSPNNMANHLLQGNVDGFDNDVIRFVLNTTVGVAGLFDVADANGFKYEPEDFGQTLGVWGVPNVSYLVLPILGPSSLRDATGLAVDSFTDPLRIYFYNTDQEGWDDVRLGVTLLATREQLLGAIDDLRKNSFDYYAATRSAYTQRRADLMRNGEPASPAPSLRGAAGLSADHP